MNAYVRTAVILAVGFALGAVVARPPTYALPDRPAAPGADSVLSNVRGHLTVNGTSREMIPISVRVGDDITRLNDTAAETPALGRVYFDLDGVPVIIQLELGDR